MAWMPVVLPWDFRVYTPLAQRADIRHFEPRRDSKDEGAADDWRQSSGEGFGLHTRHPICLLTLFFVDQLCRETTGSQRMNMYFI